MAGTNPAMTAYFPLPDRRERNKPGPLLRSLRAARGEDVLVEEKIRKREAGRYVVAVRPVGGGFGRSGSPAA